MHIELLTQARSHVALDISTLAFVFNDVEGVITIVANGKDDSPEKQNDKALGWTQVALWSVDAIKIMDGPSLSN